VEFCAGIGDEACHDGVQHNFHKFFYRVPQNTVSLYHNIFDLPDQSAEVHIVGLPISAHHTSLFLAILLHYLSTLAEMG
jgi:hypothetical protein